MAPSVDSFMSGSDGFGGVVGRTVSGRFLRLAIHGQPGLQCVVRRVQGLQHAGLLGGVVELGELVKGLDAEVVVERSAGADESLVTLKIPVWSGAPEALEWYGPEAAKAAIGAFPHDGVRAMFGMRAMEGVPAGAGMLVADEALYLDERVGRQLLHVTDRKSVV